MNIQTAKTQFNLINSQNYQWGILKKLLINKLFKKYVEIYWAFEENVSKKSYKLLQVKIRRRQPMLQATEKKQLSLANSTFEDWSNL